MTFKHLKLIWWQTLFFLCLHTASLLQSTAFAQGPTLYVESGIHHSARSIAFSRDGRFAAAGSLDRTIKLWSVKPTRELLTLSNDRMSYYLTFHPTRPILASSNEDGTVTIWDLQKQQLLDTLGADNSGIKSYLTFSRSGETLFWTNEKLGTIERWDMRGNVFNQLEPIRIRSPHKLSRLSINIDGTLLAGLDEKGIMRIVDTSTWKDLYDLKMPYVVEHVEFAPVSNRFITVREYVSVQLWTYKNGDAPVPGNEKACEGVHSIAFSFDERLIGYASEKGDVVVLDSADWKEITRLRSYGNRVEKAGFAKENSLLAVQLWYDTVIALDVKKGLPVDYHPTQHPWDEQWEDKGLISERLIGVQNKGDLVRLVDQDNRELCNIILLDKERSWIVVTPDGRFDTNKDLNNIDGAHWVLGNDLFRPLPLEIFMRDYYEPRLLRRILKGETLPGIPSIAELNRLQPTIEKLSVSPHSDDPNVVDVTVKVASVAGQCFRNGKQVACESGVYDLRLYRDGQLVKQSPVPASDQATDNGSGTNWRQQLQQWRQISRVTTKDSKPVTASSGPQAITLTDIQLPRRAGVSQVEFTAYAFNEDRVKSATSEPAIYRLPQPRPGVQRRAYLITVGVDVTSAGWRLRFARKGVTDIEELLQKSFKSQYEVVPVQLISAYQKNSDELINLATKRHIQTVLNILSGRKVERAEREKIPHQEQLQAATPDDLVVVYVASHGYADPVGKFYAMPSDIGPPLGVSEELLDRCLKNSEQSSSCEGGRNLLQHSISSDELTQWIEAIDAGQMVLILDSCHSGAVSGLGFKPGPMGDRSFGQLSYDKGMLVLAATQAEQLDTGTLELGNRSLLTYALTQQNSGPVLDLRQWLTEAEQRVPKLYQQYVKSESARTTTNDSDQEPALFDFSKRKPNQRR
jgi:WD40 repeat protein